MTPLPLPLLRLLLLVVAMDDGGVAN